MGANESDADQHKDTNCDSNFAAAAVSNGYSFYTIRQTCPTLATATATSTALVHPMDPVGAVSTVTSGSYRSRAIRCRVVSIDSPDLTS